jgi:isopentenyldiphosphate isomerase
MSEKLEIYDLDGKVLGVQDRAEFYEEARKDFAETEQVMRQVKTVEFFILNSKGEIYIQKRSDNKDQNPGLYDKSVGGHVSAGESSDLAFQRECAEEIGVNVKLVSEDKFEQAVLNEDLKTVCVCKEIDEQMGFMSLRILPNGEHFIQPFFIKVYFGYYNGQTECVDGESSEVRVLPLKELKKEITDNPEKFTQDVKVMIEKYAEYFKPINL